MVRKPEGVQEIVFSWAEFDAAMNSLAYGIGKAPVAPTHIYGVPRGGLIPAVSLSHRLKLPILSYWYEFKSEQVLLIVDDVSDTGKTLDHVLTIAGVLGVTTYVVTIHKVPGTKIPPDFWVHKRPKDAWVKYPWEVE